MYCSKCGKELADGAKFCPNCGSQVGNVEQLTNNVPSEIDARAAANAAVENASKFMSVMLNKGAKNAKILAQKTAQASKEFTDKTKKTSQQAIAVANENNTEVGDAPTNTVDVMTENQQLVNKNYVIVHGYSELFAANPSVAIYKDSAKIGEVGRNAQTKIELADSCVLKFKCGVRSTSLDINKGVDTHVLLSFNRFTGQLKALKASDENFASVMEEKEKASGKATKMSIILMAVLFLLWLLAKGF